MEGIRAITADHQYGAGLVAVWSVIGLLLGLRGQLLDIRLCLAEFEGFPPVGGAQFGHGVDKIVAGMNWLELLGRNHNPRGWWRDLLGDRHADRGAAAQRKENHRCDKPSHHSGSFKSKMRGRTYVARSFAFMSYGTPNPDFPP